MRDPPGVQSLLAWNDSFYTIYKPDCQWQSWPDILKQKRWALFRCYCFGVGVFFSTVYKAVTCRDRAVTETSWESFFARVVSNTLALFRSQKSRYFPTHTDSENGRLGAVGYGSGSNRWPKGCSDWLELLPGPRGEGTASKKCSTVEIIQAHCLFLF